MDLLLHFFHLEFESKADKFYTSVFGIFRKDKTILSHIAKKLEAFQFFQNRCPKKHPTKKSFMIFR